MITQECPNRSSTQQAERRRAHTPCNQGAPRGRAKRAARSFSAEHEAIVLAITGAATMTCLAVIVPVLVLALG